MLPRVDTALSYSQIADLLDLSKATVARALAKDTFGIRRLRTWSVDSADPTRERFDDTWIEAGAHRVAWPDAQLRHGLISAEERDQINDQTVIGSVSHYRLDIWYTVRDTARIREGMKYSM